MSEASANEVGQDETEEVVEATENQEEVVEGEILPESGKDEIKQLQGALEEAEAAAQESRDQALRAQAEMENSRRRAALDVEKARKFALEKFASDLLPVRDSLELGLQAIDSAEEHEAMLKLREGSELTLKMLSDVMVKYEILEAGVIGESFNPEIHQAITMQESAEHEPNTVMMVMQKGYTLNSRLIRPAMVIVSKVSPDSAPKIDETA